jgi:FlaA1/EpsC-like NDP-sugar epimerase
MSASQVLRVRLLSYPRSIKRLMLVAVDLSVLTACLWLAFLLKFDVATAGIHTSPWLYVCALASALAAFSMLGLYRAVVRYISFRALFSVFLGGAISALCVWWAGDTVAAGGLPASLAMIYWLSAVSGISGARIVARWLVSPRTNSRLPVVIYGAGEAGAQLAATLASGGQMSPVAYVDEKEALHGATVSGVRVLPVERLPVLVRDYGIGHVLLAVPGATRRRRAEIIQQLVDLGVHVQTVPDLYEILSGRASLADLRDISVADLLGRDPVAPQPALLGASIRGKSVMVTGAGGSIGSELCRQIVEQNPKTLVLFELSEIALYEIDRELRSVMLKKGSSVQLITLLGNSRHRDRLRDVMLAYGVQTVYHAAAYKHVPIVEQNVIEGMHNNVFATWNAAEAAVEAKVETFVLVSTDKAVHPTNVMGATKRFAEICLQAMQERQRTTRFCMVRFGNVLASSGSVVPLFQDQIRAGGPVTVTHPDVRRYFMTIPEAASLVLQAGSMARGGEVFVLDMGQPVRIDELARRMIALSAHTVRDERNPEGDIEIQYTGLRPGEKLYEELLIGENVSGTEHPMILRALEHAPGWEVVQGLLAEMLRALERFDCERARQLLGQAVQEYKPAAQMHDLVWAARHQPLDVEEAPERRVDQVVRHLRAVPRADL